MACLFGGGAHVRVVTGFDPDQTRATVYINDPWQNGMTTFALPNSGSAYTQTYMSFTNQQDQLATSEATIVGAVYVAHLTSAPFGPDVC